MASTSTLPATKQGLDTSFEDMRGYVDTSVDTLTAEMDRQFMEVQGKITELSAKLDAKFAEVLTAIREQQHGP